MNFFKSKEAEVISCALILELSPQTIAVGILLKDGKSIPTLIFSHREFVLYKHKPTSREIHLKLSKLLEKIVEKDIFSFLKNYRLEGKSLSISEVFVMHSPAWSQSLARKVRIDNEKEILITRANIDKIAKESAIKSEELANLKLISRTIGNIDLNGYGVASPWNKRAKKLSFTSHENYIDQTFVNLVEKEIGKRFRAEIIHTTEGHAIYEMMRTGQIALNEVALVHIGGETTEIVLIKEGALIGSSSIPYGVSTLCRAFGGKSDRDQELSYSHIIANLSRTRSLSKAEKTCYEEGVKDWQTSVEKAIQGLIKGTPYPATTYLVALPHYRLIVRDVFTEKFLSQFQRGHIEVKAVFDDVHDKSIYTIDKKVLHDPILSIAVLSYLI